MKQCWFVNCANVGEPEPGFDFYVCNGCLEHFEDVLLGLAAEKATQN
jgi:hypothetical protein